jgi:predicted  nucleic acid-binding Zn-ribbon protein
MSKRISFLLAVMAISVCMALVDRRVAAEAKTGTSAQDVKKETKEALEATKEFTLQQKEDFQKKIQAELDRMQQQIDHLRAKADHAKTEAQADLNIAIAELQRRKDAAGKKLQELESASEKAWGNIKSGLNTAMKDLEKSYKRALSHFP